MNRRDAMRHTVGITSSVLLSASPQIASASDDLRGKAKSILFINMHGAPPLQEMYRPQYKAPRGSSYRGPYNPIKTATPGLYFSEKIPKLAQMSDKLTIVQSALAKTDEHDPARSQLYMFYDKNQEEAPIGELAGWDLVRNGLPPYVATQCLTSSYRTPNFLSEYWPSLFVLVDEDTGEFMAPEVTPDPNIQRRTDLLRDLESLQKKFPSRIADDMARLREHAYRSVMGNGYKKAFTLDEKRMHKIFGAKTPGVKAAMLSLQLAENGAGVVVFNYSPHPGGLDMHGRNPKPVSALPGIPEGMERFAGEIDAILSGLLTHAPESDVVTVALQEFGRGPMNDNQVPGRDHDVRFGWIARGGLFKEGYVHGDYDRLNGDITDDPLLATHIAPTALAAAEEDPVDMHPEWKEMIEKKLLNVRDDEARTRMRR